MTSDWDERYRSGDTPWNSGLPSRELLRVLDERSIRPCRAVELGCGTGTNAIALAERGFDVTAFDLSDVALEQAREKSARASVTIDFRQADLCRLSDGNARLAPFDFVFDRGCFHCARRIDVEGYLRTLQLLTAPGARLLILTGNANEVTEKGPPRLTEAEIRAELGRLFDVVSIREFRFEDPGGVDGPLGWSVFLRRP